MDDARTKQLGEDTVVVEVGNKALLTTDTRKYVLDAYASRIAERGEALDLRASALRLAAGRQRDQDADLKSEERRLLELERSMRRDMVSFLENLSVRERRVAEKELFTGIRLPPQTICAPTVAPRSQSCWTLVQSDSTSFGSRDAQVEKSDFLVALRSSQASKSTSQQPSSVREEEDSRKEKLLEDWVKIEYRKENSLQRREDTQAHRLVNYQALIDVSKVLRELVCRECRRQRGYTGMPFANLSDDRIEGMDAIELATAASDIMLYIGTALENIERERLIIENQKVELAARELEVLGKESEIRSRDVTAYNATEQCRLQFQSASDCLDKIKTEKAFLREELANLEHRETLLLARRSSIPESSFGRGPVSGLNFTSPASGTAREAAWDARKANGDELTKCVNSSSGPPDDTAECSRNKCEFVRLTPPRASQRNEDCCEPPVSLTESKEEFPVGARTVPPEDGYQHRVEIAEPGMRSTENTICGPASNLVRRNQNAAGDRKLSHELLVELNTGRTVWSHRVSRLTAILDCMIPIWSSRSATDLMLSIRSRLAKLAEEMQTSVSSYNAPLQDIVKREEAAHLRWSTRVKIELNAIREVQVAWVMSLGKDFNPLRLRCALPRMEDCTVVRIRNRSAIECADDEEVMEAHFDNGANSLSDTKTVYDADEVVSCPGPSLATEAEADPNLSMRVRSALLDYEKMSTRYSEGANYTEPGVRY